MKVFVSLLVLLAIAGCNTDIVVTPQLKQIEHKCFYLEPLNTKNDSIGQVLRDVIEKEFVRQSFELCNEGDASILISGSAFLTARTEGSNNFFGGNTLSTQAIESISLTAKDRSGKLLATASYDNNDRLSASKLGMKFGRDLANKLK